MLIAYVLRFGPEVSDSQQTWGAFGDFIGGVLNPVLGTLTLVGVAFTVLLQVQLLRDQRLLGQHETFQALITHILEACDRHFASAELVVGTQDVIYMRNAEGLAYALKGGILLGADGYCLRGREAFHAMLALLAYRVERGINTARRPEEEERSYRIDGARRLFTEFDYAIGPAVRLLSDLLRTCGIYDVMYQKHVNPKYNGAPFDVANLDSLHRPSMPAPGSYAKIAVNSRTIEEFQIALIFLSCVTPPEADDVIASVYRYQLFKTLPPDWWGRHYLPLLPPITT